MVTTPPDLSIRNRRSLIAALMLAAGMLCLGFAAVPLYRIFCEATGFDGTTRRARAGEQVKVAAGHMMSIRFDANVKPGMGWRFRPEKETQTVTIGAKNMAIFLAENMSGKPVTGQAAFNVTPEQAGRYFTKIQCFCFTEQTLRPGQKVRMPVIYYVDPKILDDPDARDIQEITLSYTFYPVEKAAGAS